MANKNDFNFKNPIDPFTGKPIDVEEKLKEPINIFKSEPISLQKDMAGFMNDIMRLKEESYSPADTESKVLTTITSVQAPPSNLIVPPPPRAIPTTSEGGANVSYETKIVCHLGAVAQQGFAVDGPPIPL